jgi:hypothetical protein
MAAPLLSFLLASSDAAPAYPADAVFAAFSAVCHDINDFGTATKEAKAKGWVEVPANDEPHLDKLVGIGLSQAPDGRKISTSFRRTVKGRTLYLNLARYEDAKIWGNGCRIYDFAASSEISQSTLEKLMKRPSTFRQAQEGLLTKLSWDPGWPNGITVEAAHVPPGSALTDRTGLIGTVLVAQATGHATP